MRRAPDGPVDLGPRRSPRWWAGVTLLLLAATACAVVASIDPYGIGGTVYGIAAALLLPVIVAAPLLRGARPLRIWLVQTAGAACLLLSLVTEDIDLAIGPVNALDLTYFAGFLFLILWLALLGRKVGHPRDRHVVVDAAAFTVGAALSSWVAVLAPLVGGSEFPSGLVGMIYPTLDVLLLTLAVHLMGRLQRRVVAAEWLVGSLAMELLVDLSASVSGVVAPHLHDPILAFSLLPFAGLAIASSDRSVVALTTPPPGPPDPRRAGRPTVLALFTVFPILLSTAVPPEGGVDIAVRTVLTGLLLFLLFLRLAHMLRALVQMEADSRHRATHDPLTGLYNRAALLESLRRRRRRDAASGVCTAIVYLDCDGFKEVNDTWGHAAGDALLQDIARGLPAWLGESTAVGRQGGDEFVVLGTAEDDAAALVLAQRVREFFDRPLHTLPGRTHTMTPSIGLAVVPPDDTTPADDLLARADSAMYAAKRGGRGRIVVFDEDLGSRTRSDARIGDRLEATLADDPFVVHLMPIRGGADYATTVGWEALARWEDAELGVVPPTVFIPVAERLGLIGEVGRLVLRHACRDLATLIAADLPGAGPELCVHVNVSPTQLLHPGYVDEVCAALDDAGLPARHLRLEVTETLLVDEGPDVFDVLCRLGSLGVRMCLDDFGTGYASLATLLRLPLDCVKLDQSIVVDLGGEARSTRRAAAVMSLVQSVGVTDVVAEGVETETQARTLAELGCPMVQGWLYGRPEPAAEILRRHATGSTSPGASRPAGSAAST